MEGDSPQKQMPEPRIFVERTLALIKPDAIHKTDEIEDVILQSGFTILQVRKWRDDTFVLNILRGAWDGFWNGYNRKICPFGS